MKDKHRSDYAHFWNCLFWDHHIRVGWQICALQVSIPGEPDPTTIGLFLRRLLYLLSKPDVAAGVMGVDELASLAATAEADAKPTPGKARQAAKATKAAKVQNLKQIPVSKVEPVADVAEGTANKPKVVRPGKRKRGLLPDASDLSAEQQRHSRRQKVDSLPVLHS